MAVERQARERRLSPRSELNFDLKYSVDAQGAFLTMSRDISVTGVSFQTEQICPSGTQLHLQFGRTGSPAIVQASGRVVRAWREGRANYAAVEFTSIAIDKLREILHDLHLRVG